MITLPNKQHLILIVGVALLLSVVAVCLLVQPVRASVTEAAGTLFGTAPPVTIINDTERTAQLQEKLSSLEAEVQAMKELRTQDEQRLQQLTDQYALAVREVAQVHDSLMSAVAAVNRTSASAVRSPLPAGGSGSSLPISLPSSAGPVSSTVSGKVSLNRATVSELQTLPGIGPSYAQRIIEYREANGPFSSIDDLENVKGIGPATVAKLRDKVTL
jgi:competence ComEA-like helix-hairpin-helix protein